MQENIYLVCKLLKDFYFWQYKDLAIDKMQYAKGLKFKDYFLHSCARVYMKT